MAACLVTVEENTILNMVVMLVVTLVNSITNSRISNLLKGLVLDQVPWPWEVSGKLVPSDHAPIFFIKVGGGILGGLLLEDAYDHVVDNAYDDGFRDGTWCS